MHAAVPEPIFVTRREAAKLCSCCERTIADLAKRGVIDEVRVGRFIRYPVASLKAFRSDPGTPGTSK